LIAVGRAACSRPLQRPIEAHYMTASRLRPKASSSLARHRNRRAVRPEGPHPTVDRGTRPTNPPPLLQGNGRRIRPLHSYQKCWGVASALTPDPHFGEIRTGPGDSSFQVCDAIAGTVIFLEAAPACCLTRRARNRSRACGPVGHFTALQLDTIVLPKATLAVAPRKLAVFRAPHRGYDRTESPIGRK